MPETQLPNSAAPQLPTFCVDLDGTIVELQDGPYDPQAPLAPCLPGAIAAINALADHYEIVVLTARLNLAGTHRAILHELQSRGLRVAWVTNVKQPAVAYIDDRAVHFCGWERLPLSLANQSEVPAAVTLEVMDALKAALCQGVPS